MLDSVDVSELDYDRLEQRAADLGSVEVLPIARQLTRIFLRSITDVRMRDDLTMLVTKLILGEAPPINKDIYDEGLKIAKKYGASAEDQAKLGAYFAKIGYLLDVDGHISDSNVVNEFKVRTYRALETFYADRPGTEVPELGEDQVLRRSFFDLLFRTHKDRPIDEMIETFGKATQEDIFTMHPTGILTVAAALELRRIHDLSIAFARAPSEMRWHQLTQAIEHFASPEFSLTPVVESGPNKGNKTQLTVSGEVDYETLYMRNNRTAEDAVYREADEAFEYRYGSQYTVARKINLQLKRKDGGWTGTDVDGNKNKYAAFMLEKIIKRKLEDANVYWEYLREVEKEAVSLQPELSGKVWSVANKWSEIFAEAQAVLRAQLGRLEDGKSADGQIRLTPKAYNEISETAANAFAKYGTINQLSKRFIGEIKEQLQPYIDQNIDPPAGLLQLYRRLRDSGLSLAHSEIRENSSVFQKVIEHLLADFEHPLLKGKKFHELVNSKGDADQTKRAEFLNTIIKENHGRLENLVKNALARIESKPEDLDDPESTEFLVYHTLKRLENAHRHEGSVQNLLIAECKGVGDIMTAFTLQRMVSAYVDDGRQLQLHVCPLFEDPDMLSKMARISKAALSYSTYREHVRSLGNVIKIMRAYSDNWRLTGTIASISGLMGSHYETLQRHGNGTHGPDTETITLRGRGADSEQVTVEYHEGMGECDMHRGGGRDRGARMWQYGSQEHSKGTFQGIADFLNMANIIARLSRTIESGFVYASHLIFQKHSISSSPSEDFVIAAGKGTIKTFLKRHLGREAREFLTSLIINPKAAGATRNGSSRASGRGSEGAVNDDYIEQELVDLATSRAITTSKLWSEANIVQTWAVADVWVKSMNDLWKKNHKGIQEYLVERANHLVETGHLPPRTNNVTVAELYNEKEGLTALAFQTLYHDNRAPTFRYILDVVAAGVRRSPFELLEHRKEIEEGLGLGRRQTKYMDTMRREFIAAAKLTVQIFAPQSLPTDPDQFTPKTENCQRLRQIVIRDGLADLELAEKGRYANLVHALRDGSMFAYSEAKKAGTHIKTRNLWERAWRELGAGNDSAYYGRHGSSDAGVRTGRRIIRNERRKLAA